MAGEMYLSGLTGTGFDYDTYLSKLAELKSIPIQQLQQKQNELIAKQTAIVEIKSALADFSSPLSTLQNLDSYDKLNANLSNNSVATVSIDSSKAKTGTYNLEVLNTARENSYLISPATTVSDVNEKFADSGTLTINYKKDGVAKTLDIDYNNKSLSDIVNEINNSENLNATIINNGSSTNPDYKILVTSNFTGTSNQITGISDSDSDDNKGFDISNSTETMTALDAQIRLNGILFTNSTNDFKDILSGVSIEAKESGTATLTIKKDFKEITDSVEKILNSYNKLKDTINNATSKGQPLSTETSLNSITRSIFNKISSTLAKYGIVDAIGEGEAATGYLKVNSENLNNFLENGDYDAKTILSSFSSDLEKYVNNFLDNMTITNNKYIEQSKKIENDIENKTERLQKEIETLRIKYAKLDVYLSELQSMQVRIQNFSTYLSGGNDSNN